MKKAEGITIVNYKVNCPYCGETSYRHIHKSKWERVEFGDGKPYGHVICKECGKTFEMHIGEEIL